MDFPAAGCYNKKAAEFLRCIVLKKVPAGRHVRTAGTPTGKFVAESVRGCKAACAVLRQILSPGANTATASCGRNREPPLAQRSEYASIIPDAPHIQGTARGTPSKYASGRRPALHIWSTATRSSAPVFASTHCGAPQKSAKRKRNAVCLLQGRCDARCKSREPQSKEFLSRGCAQKWVPPKAFRFWTGKGGVRRA